MVFLTIGFAVFSLLGLGTEATYDGNETNVPSDPKVVRPIPGPERVEAPGVENLFRLSPRLLSGGQPEGRKGFDALKRLGVKTIVSVDGSTPDVEEARCLGMRYVHLPVGYDGIPRVQAVRLIKAIRDLPGPVFVHCHHGKHRGPAAAAVCGLATEGWGRDQARSWLECAGTDPRYKGLFATVERFVPPSAEELGRVSKDDLPERAEVPGLVEVMVKIDGHWDNLKAIKKAAFCPHLKAPNLDPTHEAAMLTERFRELSSQEITKTKGREFADMMEGAEGEASSLETALKSYAKERTPKAKGTAEAAFSRVGRSCSACHARFRDERERR